MFNLSDPRRFGKAAAGTGMVLAPLLFLASAIVSPRLDSSEADQLAVVAGHMDRWFVSNLLGLVGLVLLVPAILGLMHMLRERQAALGHVGAAVSLIGVLLAVGATAIGFVIWQMAAAGADRAEMVALFQRLTDTAGTFVPFYLGGLGLTVGIVVLCAGLVLARAVHWSIALALAAGVVLIGVGYAAFSVPVLIVGSAFMLVGMGSIGRLVLTEPQEDWEHTPEFRGFRPLAGH